MNGLTVNPTKIFRFMQELTTLEIERHEVCSVAFQRLRAALMEIVRVTQEDSAFIRVADRTRGLLYSLLLEPIEFDLLAPDSLKTAGVDKHALTPLGPTVLRAVAQAEVALQQLRTDGNALTKLLGDLTASELATRATVGVYCRRWAAASVREVMTRSEVDADSIRFYHSVRDYELAEPIDSLFVIGPLSQRGYSTLPPAIVNAPRQKRLLQLVWAGLADDSGFGADPLIGCISPTAILGEGDSEVGVGPQHLWTNSSSRRVVVHGGWPDADALDEPIDELVELESRRLRDEGNRGACLVVLADRQATFIAPGTRLLAWTERDGAWQAVRVPCEDLHSNDYVMRADIGDVDLGEHHGRDGSMTLRWKSALSASIRTDLSGLLSRLRQMGIDLLHLKSHLERWAKPATSVIHAPQQREHFRILTEVLNPDWGGAERIGGAPAWMIAWREIQRSRGLAIKTGMQEQEIVDEILLESLNGQQVPIELAEGHLEFSFGLPQGAALVGTLTCARVEQVQFGFHAPESMFFARIPVSEAYQWRD